MLQLTNATAEFRVRDRGIGIPKEKLPKVFGDYFRASEAVQHNNASTGLGLAIVRQVARDAGIAVEVQSAPGWGTCFSLTIPLRDRRSPPASIDSRPPGAADGR
jgi:signal transduction histidine kinase